MDKVAKTFGDLSNLNEVNIDPLGSVKREASERMKTALVAASLDDPLSAFSSIQQVTILRVYHQVCRIVKYIELMDKLEDKLYDLIDDELSTIESFSESNFSNITKLLVIQEKLQKSVIESNKLLAPYLDMAQYPAFNAIEASTPVDAKILEVSSTQRNALRENAGAILEELSKLPESTPASE